MKQDCSHDITTAQIRLIHVVPVWKRSLLAFTAASRLCNRLEFCQVIQKQTLSKQMESGKHAFNLSCDNWTCYHSQ